MLPSYLLTSVIYATNSFQKLIRSIFLTNNVTIFFKKWDGDAWGHLTISAAYEIFCKCLFLIKYNFLAAKQVWWNDEKSWLTNFCYLLTYYMAPHITWKWACFLKKISSDSNFLNWFGMFSFFFCELQLR